MEEIPFREVTTEEVVPFSLREAVERAEVEAIRKALEKAEGVHYRAAEILGISERTLRYKLSKYRGRI